MHRGEVWWGDVPGNKRRPVLILTRERFIPQLTSLLVAPIATTVRTTPTEVVMAPVDVLSTECAANFDNVFTLHKTRLVARAAVLPEDSWPRSATHTASPRAAETPERRCGRLVGSCR